MKGIKKIELPQMIAVAFMIVFLVLVEWFVVSSLAKNHYIRRNEAIMKKAEEDDAKQYNEAVEVQTQTIGNTVFTVSYPTVNQQIVEPLYVQSGIKGFLRVTIDAQYTQSNQLKINQIFLMPFLSNILLEYFFLFLENSSLIFDILHSIKI